LFQQDGALSHTTKSTLRWLDSNAIEWMLHPSGSPDLNLIKPLWHTFKQLIRNREHIPTTLDKLKDATREAWDQITVVDIDKHINKMEFGVDAGIQNVCITQSNVIRPKKAITRYFW